MKTIAGIERDPFISRFDNILSRGLCTGVGIKEGQMCIEAAICASLDLPFSDDPQCVTESVRAYKIQINDSNWSSPEKRAKELRNIGIAQLGSKGVVDDLVFSIRLAELTIQVLIPTLFREIFSNNKECLEMAKLCELNPYAAKAASAACAAKAASEATNPDKYLILSVSLATQVLKELNSPGIDWL